MNPAKIVKRSCRTCGWSGEYTSGGRADYAKRKHSCARHIEKAQTRARRLARAAAVDRTPKLCRHKIAEHVHGTHACYVLDACRCLKCAAANTRYEHDRSRQHAYGRWDNYVPAEPARAHIRSLMDQGMGLKRIVAVSDVSQGLLWKLVYGKKRPDGTRTPSVRVRKDTEARILAIRPDLAPGARVDATGTRRRIQALVCLGYSVNYLGERLGILSSNMHTMLHHRGEVTVRTVKAVEELYDELSMTPNQPADHYRRGAATRARNYAAAMGWVPPLGWDEDTIDDPTMEPAGVALEHIREIPLDEVAIQRRMSGDKTVKLTRPEKIELAKRWVAAGHSLIAWDRITGLTRIDRYLGEAA